MGRFNLGQKGVAMRLAVGLSLAAGLSLTSWAAAAPKAAPAPVEVMVVGTFHMSNPGQDLNNVKADDVLAPKRQAEIAAVTAALARFKPTKVAVEWPAEIVAERWAGYQAGTLPASRNEVVQLGFRLAKATGAQAVGVDVDGDFPFEAVQAYAEAHGQAGLIAAAMTQAQAEVVAEEAVLARSGVAGVLRYVNDPAKVAEGQGFYRSMLRVGGGAQQPGAELLTAWYRRNALICANIVQQARPGDRIVVLFGSGHAFFLKQCAAETPGLRLVEPTAYLPR
ncbi:DUF5694 domain-containing protein [Phenylobacterium soli]|uniref:TraB/GumN family protein n=1 Tax=Phenylobacterium soli TaxID=2170551 RepID=A0A328AF34_9CAUL|nr:DUF5694 domain-containing protein [Phenylobacterium soli]RAK53145.1 hypothetical protein DJ017_00655 [Phenylobacterium soli]